MAQASVSNSTSLQYSLVSFGISPYFSEAAKSASTWVTSASILGAPPSDRLLLERASIWSIDRSPHLGSKLSFELVLAGLSCKTDDLPAPRHPDSQTTRYL